jgi:TolB protein
VFDSNRQRAATDPINRSGLFVMNVDGTGQTPLVRGSSATWAPDSRRIAFHASASSGGLPIKADPGAATTDNDIFVLDVDDFLKTGGKSKNLTNSPSAIDDDPAWSPDGRRIAFTSHAVTDNPTDSKTAEIYLINADGSGTQTRLTNNNEEERAPSWSSDGTRIVFMCRKGSPQQPGGVSTFELCVMNCDGTSVVRLTNNNVADLTPSWSPDGRTIVFHRRVGGQAQFQLFTINADGSGEKQLTFPPGFNAFASFGQVR